VKFSGVSYLPPRLIATCEHNCYVFTVVYRAPMCSRVSKLHVPTLDAAADSKSTTFHLYGCCTPVQLKSWVNPAVAPNVWSANGLPLYLSPKAIDAISSVYEKNDHKPTRVVFRRGCYDLMDYFGFCCVTRQCCDAWAECCLGFCCCCCFACMYCGAWMQCALPNYDHPNSVSEIWFAEKSGSPCISNPNKACLLNCCFCCLPNQCGQCCVRTVSISPKDVKVITDRVVSYGFVEHTMVPPMVQKMVLSACSAMTLIKPPRKMNKNESAASFPRLGAEMVLLDEQERQLLKCTPDPILEMTPLAGQASQEVPRAIDASPAPEPVAVNPTPAPASPVASVNAIEVSSTSFAAQPLVNNPN
jgi:hypothetical protein